MTIRTKANSDSFKNNFDRIFGTDAERKEKAAKEKATMDERWQAMEKAMKSSKATNVQAGFEPFKSPIDGSIISCRSKLREHNKRHGVTDIRDYGDEWFEKKAEERRRETLGQTSEAERERRAIVEKTLYQYGLLR